MSDMGNAKAARPVKSLLDRLREIIASPIICVSRLVQQINGLDARQNDFLVLRDQIFRMEQSIAALELREKALRKDSVALHLRTRAEFVSSLRLLSGSSQANASPQPWQKFNISNIFSELQQAYPRAYDIWQRLLANGERVYAESPAANLSVNENPNAVLFKDFCICYRHGSVLDVGCGRWPTPIYLEDYPVESIAAFDPFGLQQQHPFIFVRAVAEQIPWNDRSFDTVIASTSLDHLLDLDRGVSEISRVLKSDGQFLIWVGFIPGSKEYDPASAVLEAIDEFHLFHFERRWFEKLMSKYFTISECIDVDGTSFFYRMRPSRS